GKGGKGDANQIAHGKGKAQSNYSTQQTERSRFDQELKENGAPARPERFSRPDFFRPLFHANESDIHDADGTDKKRKAGDEKPCYGDGVFNRLKCALYRLLFVNTEIVVFLMRYGAVLSYQTIQVLFGLF